MSYLITTIVILLILAVWLAHDVLQRKHAIIHNFPIIGHFRYWLEAIGPELRQYIVTNNDEERPFSRDERRWVYASSKRDNNYFGFGTDNDLEASPNYLIIRHSAFPLNEPASGDQDYDPETALLAFGLGCDMINVGREAMLSIGCIQAQRCHTGHCPTGVATQNRWLMSGLDPTHKASRFANYLVTLRKELLQLSRACGVAHPGLISSDHFEILDACFVTKSLSQCFGYADASKNSSTKP